MGKSGNNKSAFIWGGSFFLVFLLVFGLVYFNGLNKVIDEDKSLPINPETISIADFSQQLALEKPGTIASTQDILVTAQANGKVANIYFREGETVQGGQPVIGLSDTIASYKLQVDNAKNSLDRAILTKEQNERSIDQQIEMYKNAYDNAQQAFSYAQKAAELAVKKADIDINNADSSIDALKSSFGTEKTLVLSFINTVVDAADKLLGVSDFYKNNLDEGRDIYVGARDLKGKENAKQQVRGLYTIRDKIKGLGDIPATNEELKNSTNMLEEGVNTASNLAGTMIEVMRNSISSAGTLSQNDINNYITTFQAYQATTSSMGNIRSVITEYKSRVDAQISESGTITQDAANIGYENTLASTENSLFQAEIGLKNAKLNYETALENKDVQINLLSNAIVAAKIAYESALTQYNKLTVRSPVSGVIGEILVSEGQEVGAGTQMFKVSGTHKKQIEVYITADEYQYIQNDKPVTVSYQDQVLTGIIDAISTVADRTNLFKATIQLDADISLLGDVAKVTFPISLKENSILPLSQVKIINENQGEVNTWKDGEVKAITVNIKKIWGTFVELQESLSGDIQIIL